MRLLIATLSAATLVLSTSNILRAAESFNVRSFGAAGDGKTMDTAAIQKAVDAAAVRGGRVVLGPGTYLTATIRLKSHIDFHLEKGATLLGSPDVAHYQRLNFLTLIHAHRLDKVTISGEGTIDGQGRLLTAGITGPVTRGSKPYAGEDKRPVILNFLNCTNVTVRGITLRESACWVQLYRDCNHVTIENIKVRTLAAITNDGLDIDGCSNVLIRGCDIDSQDDGICLKSSRRFCENIRIENCRVRSSCNAFKLGTASNVGFRNITVRNLDIHDTYLSGIALQSVDGGVLENIDISRVRIRDTNNPLFIRLGHRNPAKPPGVLRNVTISDVSAVIPDRPRSAMNKFPPYWRHQCTTLITGSITGLPGHPVRGVTLRNLSLTYGGIGKTPKPGHHRIEQLDRIPECAENYPESKMFGVLPAWGLYCRHVEDLKLDRFTLATTAPDYRPAMVFDDVKNLSIAGLQLPANVALPAIVFKDVAGITMLDGPPAPAGREFIRRIGSTTEVQRR